MTELTGWIPQPLISQIRDACPTTSGSTLCSRVDIDIDAQMVDERIGRFSTDESRLAFRIRIQGLVEKLGRIEQARESVNEAIALLE